MKIEITPDDLFELNQLQQRLTVEARHEHITADGKARGRGGYAEGVRYTDRERELGSNIAVLARIIRSASQ